MIKDLLEFKGNQGFWGITEYSDDGMSSIIRLDDGMTITIQSNENTKDLLEHTAFLISNAPKMIQTLVSTYIKLNQLSKSDISFAIKTDETRAMLRNTIAYALKLTSYEVQEYVESKY